jgi:hypothetical protein
MKLILYAIILIFLNNVVINVLIETMDGRKSTLNF